MLHIDLFALPSICRILLWLSQRSFLSHCSIFSRFHGELFRTILSKTITYLWFHNCRVMSKNIHFHLHSTASPIKTTHFCRKNRAGVPKSECIKNYNSKSSSSSSGKIKTTTKKNRPTYVYMTIIIVLCAKSKGSP